MSLSMAMHNKMFIGIKKMDMIAFLIGVVGAIIGVKIARSIITIGSFSDILGKYIAFLIGGFLVGIMIANLLFS